MCILLNVKKHEKTFALNVDIFNPSDGALKELKKARERDIMKRRALTVKEQEVFENYLALTPEYQHWQPIFMVMLYTGMRVGEVTGLRWCDLDMENEAISVNHTLVYFDRRRAGEETCGFAVNLPKTKAGERTIPVVIFEAMFKAMFEQGIIEVGS